MTGNPVEPASHLELASDCARCSGLCCVALQFAKSSAFAESKPVGEPCANLGADHRCTIHDHLRDSGWSGCTVFECYGAGQRLTASHGSWRDSAHPGRLFTSFTALQSLHEVIFLLRHAPATDRRTDVEVADLLAEATAAATVVEQTAEEGLSVAEIWAPIGPIRSRVGALLTSISSQLRAHATGADYSYADLAGRDLRAQHLVGGSLRGAVLIAADLRETDLHQADLLGADLRDCDVRGSSLNGALFLTQPQINAARGDAQTTLPPGLRRPSHWLSAN